MFKIVERTGQIIAKYAAAVLFLPRAHTSMPRDISIHLFRDGVADKFKVAARGETGLMRPGIPVLTRRVAAPHPARACGYEPERLNSAR